MTTIKIPVSEFKARCTEYIRNLDAKSIAYEITNRDRVVAIVSLPEAEREPRAAWIESIQGAVHRYEGPFLPAVDPNDWNANQGK